MQECFTEPMATELAMLRQKRRVETDHITYDCMHAVSGAPGAWPVCRKQGKRVDRSLLKVLEGCTAPLCLLCADFVPGDDEVNLGGGPRTVAELALPVRVRNTLLANAIATVDDLLPLKGIDVMRMNRAGPRTAAVVRGALSTLGIKWGW